MSQPDNLPAAAVSRPPCEVWSIEPASALDRIHVFWMDVAPGAGYVTIICYGQAWTTYFGSMGKATSIKEFFAGCGTDYMLTKLGIGAHLKSTSRDNKYLGRIIDAVRAAVQQETLAGVSPQADEK